MTAFDDNAVPRIRESQLRILAANATYDPSRKCQLRIRIFRSATSAHTQRLQKKFQKSVKTFKKTKWKILAKHLQKHLHQWGAALPQKRSEKTSEKISDQTWQMGGKQTEQRFGTRVFYRRAPMCFMSVNRMRIFARWLGALSVPTPWIPQENIHENRAGKNTPNGTKRGRKMKNGYNIAVERPLLVQCQPDASPTSPADRVANSFRSVSPAHPCRMRS